MEKTKFQKVREWHDKHNEPANFTKDSFREHDAFLQRMPQYINNQLAQYDSDLQHIVNIQYISLYICAKIGIDMDIVCKNHPDWRRQIYTPDKLATILTQVANLQNAISCENCDDLIACLFYIYQISSNYCSEIDYLFEITHAKYVEFAKHLQAQNTAQNAACHTEHGELLH